MENAWPDNIEPLRAGLSDEEFADLLDQERWTDEEVAMLRAAGMRVVTPEEARAGFIPPDQLRPSRGQVVWDPATGSHLVASAWSHFRHATLDQELEAGLPGSYASRTSRTAPPTTCTPGSPARASRAGCGRRASSSSGPEFMSGIMAPG